jgi:hypothetical protein
VNTGEIDAPEKRWYFDRCPVHRQLQHRGWRCLGDYIAIEGKYDDNPTEMGWGLLRIALVRTLIAAQSTGSFSTEGGAVLKTGYMAMVHL